ncbi:hypothetical protein [Candidatus Arsenophonus nilaparvatae]|uniref:hypothetical protein n=1 Tax=Candidatus Arsenophonus nilaparvatae TaxID=1247023 RepID=UPI00165155FE
MGINADHFLHFFIVSVELVVGLVGNAKSLLIAWGTGAAMSLDISSKIAFIGRFSDLFRDFA